MITKLSQFSKIPPLARLIAHLRTPLFWNGYALIVSSITTAGLGLVYWLIAARIYPAEVVGLNSAILSSMILLANVSQLKLDNVLNRFIPCAGYSTNRLIVRAYLLSSIMAIIACFIFISGINVWTPTLGFLKDQPILAIWFCLSTVAWCIFVLQDSALVGLRQAQWVPIENIIYALIKIGLLTVFAGSLTRYGLFASWTFPLMILLLPINILIFRHLIPQHIQATKHTATPIIPRQIARYTAGDYFSSLLDMTTFSILPLIVVERIGATANAYFYLALTIINPLHLMSLNMGMSLITESAADQTQLASYSLRTFLQTLRILTPIVIVIVIASPYILWLFGSFYSAEGSILLRLLCLSAIPNVVTTIYLSVARVQRDMQSMILVMSIQGFLVFTLSLVLLEMYGINGIGVAFLLSETIVAVVLIFTKLRKLWFPEFSKPTL